MRARHIVGKWITGLMCCAAWIIQVPPAHCSITRARVWFSTDVLVATDGKLAGVYVNGNRLAKRKIVPVLSSGGVSCVDLWIHTHPGDWLVLHVVCPKGLMQRRGVAVAGRRRGNGVFLSEAHTRQWCAISNAAQASKFIDLRDFGRQAPAVIPQHPSNHCFTMVAKHTNFDDGEVIWASGNPREVWIKCLIPRQATPATGIPDNTGHPAQPAAERKRSAVQPIASGLYTLANQYSHLMLNDPGHSDQSGTAIDQADADGGKHQNWKFTYQGHGLYTIENAFSKLYLSGPGSNPHPGDLLRQESENQKANQQWKLQRQGDGFLCINALSGLAMDDDGHMTKPGTAVVLWSVHHVHVIGNQAWIFQKVQGVQVGTKPQGIAAPAVHRAAPMPSFTDVLAEKAIKTYQTQIRIAHANYRKALAKAAGTCVTALHAALVTAMTTNRPGETRKLTVIITAMKHPLYHPVIATTFTIPSAQYAWRRYMVNRAQVRANYLIVRDRLWRQLASTLGGKALMEAIDSGNVADALLIHQIVRRLDRENRNPLAFPGNKP